MNLADLPYFSEGSKPLRVGGAGAPSDTAENPRPAAPLVPDRSGPRQLTLPGLAESLLPRPQVDQPEPEADEFDSLKDYGGPDGAHFGLPSDQWVENPIYKEDVYDQQTEQSMAHYRRGLRPVREDTFVPPWRVNSVQRTVNPEAIEHQVQHANPLGLRQDPEVTEYVGDDGKPAYMLYDGNHRVNAAQRRGQLLMPANVARYEVPPEPYLQSGPNSMRRARA